MTKSYSTTAHFTVNTNTRQFQAFLCFTAKTNFHFNEEQAVYQSIA
jgi:hypothetical protein